MLEALQPYLLEILVSILTAIATFIGTKLKKCYEEKVNTEVKEKVVRTVVEAVEQIYKDLNGAERLEKAKESIVEMLNEKNISITELEMNMLIESVVNGFNQSKTKEE